MESLLKIYDQVEAEKCQEARFKLIPSSLPACMLAKWVTKFEKQRSEEPRQTSTESACEIAATDINCSSSKARTDSSSEAPTESPTEAKPESPTEALVILDATEETKRRQVELSDKPAKKR